MKDEVFNAVKSIYEELSQDKLLTRCLGGFTQNSNECFNSVLWALAPKTMSSGKKIIDIAADIARAEVSITEAAREARRSGVSAHKLANEEEIDAEGILYGAGIAD
ncbi:uncharacterized protein LOC116853306 isoform X2 [Odontomachus brunneus]|nr:uncharacterized protein LOC116853306 isoform X2 [Odontomachus brunneus]